MILKIFDSNTFDEIIPAGFNAVKIPLDATTKSPLDWEGARSVARRYREQGLGVFWDFDLGLFSRLPLPLDNPTQAKTFVFALEHFRDTLLREFDEETVGINLYRGDVDSITTNGHIDYLVFLASHLPQAVDTYILLDASAVEDPLCLAKLISSEKFTPLRLGVNGGVLPPQGLGWESVAGPLGYFGRDISSAQDPVAYSVAICLPAVECVEVMRPAFDQFLREKVPFRIVAEMELAKEWEGLDYLLVSSQTLTTEGRRMLMGFCAAGGTVVILGEMLGLPHEIPFEKWRVPTAIEKK